MLPVHVAVVSESSSTDPQDVARVSASLQRQATRDLGSVWGVVATVDSFPRLEDVPAGYWPILIQDDIHERNASGVHRDRNNQPYALVQYSDSWSLTASHEMLEMLIDPSGDRLVPGQSPNPAQGRVDFLVELCDPCEDEAFAYQVNSVLVSDFITPHFYDPVAAASVRYSYTGAIEKPRTILRGGYISFREPVSNHWWQQIYFEDKPEFVDKGPASRASGSLREWIDAQTPHPQLEQGLPASAPSLKRARDLEEGAVAGREAGARALREEIERLKREAPE
jgi:hypothetical protein